MERQKDGGDRDIADDIKKARKRIGISQAELAKAVGVTQSAVYNWEHSVASPSSENLGALERAIGPMTHDGLDSSDDDAIEGIGSLEDFNPYVKEEIPDVSGVYVFYDISQRPVYVGESKQIVKRIDQHEEKFWFKRPIVESASYIEVRDPRLRKQLERALIKFLKSNAVLNKAGTA